MSEREEKTGDSCMPRTMHDNPLAEDLAGIIGQYAFRAAKPRVIYEVWSTDGALGQKAHSDFYAQKADAEADLARRKAGDLQELYNWYMCWHYLR